jgi:hypothetical protein
LKDFY